MIFNAVCAHSAVAECPAALHERCYHVCPLFTAAIPPAMSRLGALALRAGDWGGLPQHNESKTILMTR